MNTPPTTTDTQPKPKVKKPTLTYMLHDPETMENAGKYNSTSHRNAALKAATKGFTRILLRRTKTKLIYEYAGEANVLDEPKVVPRGNRNIVYAKKPKAKFVKSFEYNGPKLPNEEHDEEEEKESKKTKQDELPDDAPATKRQSSSKKV